MHLQEYSSSGQKHKKTALTEDRFSQVRRGASPSLFVLRAEPKKGTPCGVPYSILPHFVRRGYPCGRPVFVTTSPSEIASLFKGGRRCVHSASKPPLKKGEDAARHQGDCFRPRHVDVFFRARCAVTRPSVICPTFCTAKLSGR